MRHTTDRAAPPGTSTTTGFFRNAAQLRLIRRLLPRPERVYVFGCSRGPEVFSLIMQYADVPDLLVEGFDIDDGVLEAARAAIYSESEVAYYGTIPDEGKPWLVFRHGRYRVRESIRRRARFAYGNILQPCPPLIREAADLVLCQNVLVHLSRELQEAALTNLHALAKPGGLVLAGGTDLDVIESMTVRLGLTPILEDCREIHEGWADRRAVWNGSPEGTRPYHALEPFGSEDRTARYVSVFRKSSLQPGYPNSSISSEECAMNAETASGGNESLQESTFPR